MMSSSYFDMFDSNFHESSLYTTSGEQYGVVNDFTPSDSVFAESGYYAGSQYFSSTSYGEEFVEPSPTDYYDTSFVLDGYESESTLSYQSYIPILYPVSNSYMLYNVVIPIEYNGAVFYNYEQYAVPIYSNSDQVTPSSNIANDLSELTGDDLLQEFNHDLTAHYDEASYSDQVTSSSNIATDLSDLNGDDLPQEFTDDFTAYSDEARGSSILIPENDFTAEERQNDIKVKKEWLYLLALSGKLRLKDSIPEVEILPAIIEDEEVNDEEAESSEESFEPLALDSCSSKSWEDIFPEIDTSDGNNEKKSPNNGVIETSHASSTNNEPPEVTFPDSGEEIYSWKDSFFRGIDDEDFGIEACFNDTFENEFNQSSYNKEVKHKSNLPLPSKKTFMILPRLNKQIQILAKIEEEEEPVEKSENLPVMVQKTPAEINKENTMDIEEECVESKQQNAEKFDNNCGLSEAIVEDGTSVKPKKKKRFKRIRRFFSELRSCFRKSGSPPG